MAEEKRFAKATWQIMEQLLEVDNLEDALSGSLEIVVKTLNSEAGRASMLCSFISASRKRMPTLTPSGICAAADRKRAV